MQGAKSHPSEQLPVLCYPMLTRFRYRVMETTMKDSWEEEKQRLTSAIEREKKLRRDSEMRERRLLDDRLAEALSEGDNIGVKVPRV
jgi:hypothetical protein